MKFHKHKPSSLLLNAHHRIYHRPAYLSPCRWLIKRCRRIIHPGPGIKSNNNGNLFFHQFPPSPRRRNSLTVLEVISGPDDGSDPQICGDYPHFGCHSKSGWPVPVCRTGIRKPGVVSLSHGESLIIIILWSRDRTGDYFFLGWGGGRFALEGPFLFYSRLFWIEDKRSVYLGYIFI